VGWCSRIRGTVAHLACLPGAAPVKCSVGIGTGAARVFDHTVLFPNTGTDMHAGRVA